MAVLIAAGPWRPLAQEVVIVAVDVKAVAKGHRVKWPMGVHVVNQREIGGFVIGRDDAAATRATFWGLRGKFGGRAVQEPRSGWCWR